MHKRMLLCGNHHILLGARRDMSDWTLCDTDAEAEMNQECAPLLKRLQEAQGRLPFPRLSNVQGPAF